MRLPPPGLLLAEHGGNGGAVTLFLSLAARQDVRCGRGGGPSSWTDTIGAALPTGQEYLHAPSKRGPRECVDSGATGARGGLSLNCSRK